MIRGLYTSASGMMVEQHRQEVIANNVANVNTAGFKKDVATFKAFPEMLLSRLNDPEQPAPVPDRRPVIGKVGTGALLDEVITMHGTGPMKQTGAPFDLAINGEGYFTIDTPQGERYTRNGSFSLNADKQLVTSEGWAVLGQNGPITVTGDNVQVTEAGAVMVDNRNVDTLRIVTFADKKALTKEGNSLYVGGQAQVAVRPMVIQGYQELSNVNPVTEMVDMITAMRSYEANQKAIQTHDQLLDKAVNEVGKL